MARLMSSFVQLPGLGRAGWSVPAVGFGGAARFDGAGAGSGAVSVGAVMDSATASSAFRCRNGASSGDGFPADPLAIRKTVAGSLHRCGCIVRG